MFRRTLPARPAGAGRCLRRLSRTGQGMAAIRTGLAARLGPVAAAKGRASGTFIQPSVIQSTEESIAIGVELREERQGRQVACGKWGLLRQGFRLPASPAGRFQTQKLPERRMTRFLSGERVSRACASTASGSGISASSLPSSACHSLSDPRFQGGSQAAVIRQRCSQHVFLERFQGGEGGAVVGVEDAYLFVLQGGHQPAVRREGQA